MHGNFFFQKKKIKNTLTLITTKYLTPPQYINYRYFYLPKDVIQTVYSEKLNYFATIVKFPFNSYRYLYTAIDIILYSFVLTNLFMYE